MNIVNNVYTADAKLARITLAVLESTLSNVLKLQNTNLCYFSNRA